MIKRIKVKSIDKANSALAQLCPDKCYAILTNIKLTFNIAKLFWYSGAQKKMAPVQKSEPLCKKMTPV